MPKTKKTKHTVKEAPAPTQVSGEPWTVDVRERLGDGFSRAALDAVCVELAGEGRQVIQIYCTDKQREIIKDFPGYSKVTLTVE